MLSSTVNIVGPATSWVTAQIAFSSILLLNAFSLSRGRLGLPAGAVKSPPNTILFAPTLYAIDVNAVITAFGMPALSSSFAIVDPQRVHVPQVVVRNAALTPELFNSPAILLPISLLFSTLVPMPHVEKK